VLNRDLWEPFLDLFASLTGRVAWEKVGGHVSIPGNERADTIATTFAAQERIALYVGDRAKYSVDLDTVAADTESTAKRSDARTQAKAKAYSYVSLMGSEIQIHKTWESCKTRVDGRKGVRYKKAISEAHEAQILQEFASHIAR
jgi:ribonuclease HI